jgi:hypothetical protein
VKITGSLFTTRMPLGLDRQGDRAVVDSKQKLDALVFLVNKVAKQSKPNIAIEVKKGDGQWQAAEVIAQAGDENLGEWAGETESSNSVVTGTVTSMTFSRSHFQVECALCKRICCFRVLVTC